MPILLATALAAGIVLASTSARAQGVTTTVPAPAPTMQIPETHGAGGTTGGMPPGTRGGSGVDSGTVITLPRTSTTLGR